jgi:hypothetical protein
MTAGLHKGAPMSLVLTIVIMIETQLMNTQSMSEVHIGQMPNSIPMENEESIRSP